MATIVSATTASAAMTITPSQAYCVGTTYTITVPAADAATLETNPSYDQIVFNFEDATTSGTIGLVSWTKGQDVTIQWTPTQAQQTTVLASPFNSTAGFGSGQLSMGPLNVVTSIAGGTQCTTPPAPPAGTGTGTGSASSIPVIGGLLSSLSAQK
ncbi:hypothetical protein ACFYUD_23180 [Nocardia tengchongensis]|uniref:hypothetical protein n=1 Tax=Nocardia tengchongensis TaxID=2055889 RepID=UPI0036AD0D83